MNALPDDMEPDGAELPYSLEAEQALLGGLFVDNDLYARVADWLKPDHFYESVHADLYAASAELIEGGSTADPVTLRRQFQGDTRLDDVDGVSYLARLMGSGASSYTGQQYARQVVDLAIRRDAIIKIGSAQAELAAGSGSATDIIHKVESDLHALTTDGRRNRGGQAFGDVLNRSLENIDRARELDGLIGISTGLRDLDRKLGGLRPSRLYVVAGRPAMGKSVVAANFARAAAQAGKNVVLFSVEMDAEEIGARLLSNLAYKTGHNIPYSRAEQGRINESDAETLRQIATTVRRLPITIVDDAPLTITQLILECQRLMRLAEKAAGRLDLVVIDYLQLLEPSDRYRGNRVQEVTEISRALKGLAKELRLPVVAMSQLSRGVEQRDNKRPQLSDLRESGAIEQDADVCVFLYRDHYYRLKAGPPKGQTEKDEWLADNDRLKNEIEFLIEKNRGGPTATIRSFVDLPTATVGDAVA